MPFPLRIDFISDVACPWCAIGLASLELALQRTHEIVAAEIHFHPFELNPGMAAEGENIDVFLGERYGADLQQLAAMRETLRQRGAAVGFLFNQHSGSRIYDTFDAHRLLHLSRDQPIKQRALKHALFKLNFTDNARISDPEVLTAAAVQAGLDAAAARELLASDRHAEEVRAAEKHWMSRGITAVPAMVINEQWLISGGQPPDAIENAIRTIAAQSGTHIIARSADGG